MRKQEHTHENHCMVQSFISIYTASLYVKKNKTKQQKMIFSNRGNLKHKFSHFFFFQVMMSNPTHSTLIEKREKKIKKKKLNNEQSTPIFKRVSWRKLKIKFKVGERLQKPLLKD